MNGSVELIQKTSSRINRKTGEEIIGQLKVAAYCRVSSDKEDQINSYKSQKKYYTQKISENVEWIFVDIYADEAITGTIDYKRSDFIRMINDAVSGKIDLIITKSVSRFARNTLDTLKYVRLLKQHNVAILFEEENINTLEMAGELLLTVLSSVAQQESETTSAHVKLGIKMKWQRGELFGFNGCLGYDYDKTTKSLFINEDEAEIVRYIFERYNDGLGVAMIGKEMERLGIKTKNGATRWHESTLRGILKNEKYVGDILAGKSFTCDPISHRRLLNMGEEDQYYMKNHHEPIISRELWESTQQILEKRAVKSGKNKRIGSRYSSKYTFSNKIHCDYCGRTVTRRSWNSEGGNRKPVWQCVSYAKYGKQNCTDSKGISEDIIQNSFIQLYNKLTKNCDSILEKFLKHVEESIYGKTFNANIKDLRGKIEVLEKRKDRIIEMMIDKQISKETYEYKIADIDKRLNDLKEKLDYEVMLKEDDTLIKNRLTKFKLLLKNKETITEFDEEVFKILVDKIILGEKANNDPYVLTFIFASNDDTKELILNSDVPIHPKYTKKETENNKIIEVLGIDVKVRIYKFEIDEVTNRKEKKLIDRIKVKAAVYG